MTGHIRVRDVVRAMVHALLEQFANQIEVCPTMGRTSGVDKRRSLAVPLFARLAQFFDSGCAAQTAKESV